MMIFRCGSKGPPTRIPEQPTFTPTVVASFSLFSVPPTATATPTAVVMTQHAVSLLQSSGSSSPPASSPPISSASSPLWGAAALAAAAGATAYVLERRRRRKEEEAAQAAEAAQKAAQKNAAFEAARVQSFLQSKDLLQKTLQNSGLSAAEQAAVKDKARTHGLAAAFGALSGLVQTAQQQAAQRTERKEKRLEAGEMTFPQKTYARIVKTASVLPSRPAASSRPPWKQPPYPDPETADMTEAERRREYMASAEYQEYRRRMVEWEQRQRYARFHEKEVAGYNATAGQSQPWWKRAWEKLGQIAQGIDNLWHKRSVRICLAAAALAMAAPTLFIGVNLATYSTFQVPIITWFGVGSNRRGVEIALANQPAIMNVANNYNTAIASGTTFVCEYNQKGKPRKECVRSVEIQPILVEAAVSVQSQWKISWWDSSFMRWIQRQEHSAEGIAQVSQSELEQWAGNLNKYLPPGATLLPQDAHASAGAVIERIAPVLEYCQQQHCDANSQVIVAAMAQNGKGFTSETLQEIYKTPKYLNQDGTVNWEKYFNDQEPRPLEGNATTILSRLVQNLRAVPGNFERQFMLQLYVNDLKMLQAKGETLPDGVDLEYLECLADRLPGASYHCRSGEEQ